MFSFGINSAIIGKHVNNFGWNRLHDEVHTSFVELAVENPKIEFVIKHKGVGWGKTKELLVNIGAHNISNLKIYGDSFDAQKLILESDVITGFCTTALLEAAIARKPIIYPLFEEARSEKYGDFLCYADALKMFDVATNKVEYKELLVERMKNPVITEGIMKYREVQFEKHVSSLNSDALQKYSELIINKVSLNDLVE
jgi:hypothetical protein